jgi:hypothetical protein
MDTILSVRDYEKITADPDPSELLWGTIKAVGINSVQVPQHSSKWPRH